MFTDSGLPLLNFPERRRRMKTVVIVKAAVVDVKKAVETSASKLVGSDVVSLLDACTCTGNCC